jgi:bacterioferritin-associated ferredoxin
MLGSGRSGQPPTNTPSVCPKARRLSTTDPQHANAGASAPPESLPIGGSVRSCVCFDVSFERIREAAGNHERGILEAHRKTGCGGRCGLCLPYIKLMLKTGQTTLPVMWSEEFNKHGIQPGRVKAIERAIARQQQSMDTDADRHAAG